MKHLSPFKTFALAALLLLSGQLAVAQQAPSIKNPSFIDYLREETDPQYKFMKSITSEELEGHLQILASDEMEGRETAEAGQKKAAKYLADQFKKIGLKPGFPGENGNGWFQEYELEKTKVEGAKISITGKKSQTLELYEDFIVYTNRSLENDIRSEMIFAGYGIQDENYDNLTGLDVKGKAAIIFNGEPMDPSGVSQVTGTDQLSVWSTNWRAKRNLFLEAGASCLIIVTPDARFEETRKAPWIHHRLESASYRLPGEEQSPNLPMIYIPESRFSSWLKKKSAKDLKMELDRTQTLPRPKFKKMEFVLETDFKREIVTAENVLGLLEGTDKKDEIIVLTAHYDHLGVRDGVIYNGADDDGTGTAALLEIADAFVRASEAGFRPRRSILFMPVSGEEKGLLGSNYYSENPAYPLKNTVCDLNIDMIGRTDSLPTKFKGPEDVDYVYVIGSNMLSTELHEANETANATLTKTTLDYTFNSLEDENRYYYRSDHYNFAKHGIPVIFYFTGVHADYHKPTDTIDKILWKKFETITRLVYGTAWEVANRDKRLEVDVEQD